MRINKFVAFASGMSRRAADRAIEEGRVLINNGQPENGYEVLPDDVVTLEGHQLSLPEISTVMLNKPPGFVVSRDGQGHQTIYDLLPDNFQELKPVGRLDRESSGLLLLTNDGDMANKLTHPSHQKEKVYEIGLLKTLTTSDEALIKDTGIMLEDGLSRLMISPLDAVRKKWRVTMSEGRNRQIRRTFATAGYTVNTLHRTHFGAYDLGRLKPGTFIDVTA